LRRSSSINTENLKGFHRILFFTYLYWLSTPIVCACRASDTHLDPPLFTVHACCPGSRFACSCMFGPVCGDDWGETASSLFFFYFFSNAILPLYVISFGYVTPGLNESAPTNSTQKIPCQNFSFKNGVRLNMKHIGRVRSIHWRSCGKW